MVLHLLTYTLIYLTLANTHLLDHYQQFLTACVVLSLILVLESNHTQQQDEGTMVEGALVVVVVKERLVEEEQVLFGNRVWVEAKGAAEGAQVLKRHEFGFLQV